MACYRIKISFEEDGVDKGPSNIDIADQRVDILTKALARIKLYSHAVVALSEESLGKVKLMDENVS